MAASKQANTRERRSKIALGVLGVILLAVVGLQVPKFMGGAHPATAASATATTTDPATQASPVAALASVAAHQSKVMFSRFHPSDPFHAQVKGASGTGGASASTAAAPPKQPPTATQKAKAPLLILIGPKAPAGTTTPAAAAPATPTVPGAFLRLDGRKVLVALDDAFPKKQPLFRLISLSRKAVWLRLLSGSFPDGSQTIKLSVGQPLRLRNQTDASVLILKMVRPVTLPAPAVAPTGAAG